MEGEESPKETGAQIKQSLGLVGRVLQSSPQNQLFRSLGQRRRARNFKFADD